jgi:hypothetical protein
MKNIKENLKETFYHKYDDRTPFEKIIGYCNNCPYSRGCLFEYPKTVRLNTMYVDEKSNYFTGCDAIIDEINKDYDELWEDYYSSRL